ncbi:RNA polymerase sigma-70 factor, ECF subfamily [Pedobacter steynii]|uniref:RNA polymerase sigma-70 factor, ECF subfamily n=1 Tax=Pedobacter steynii TaxID=430522 RepID=A0A1G9UBN1_9SPHI|nr:RNA polymerase sigma-70 factor [Pedobacter steynii]NQX40723.1 RNA polymerase sigma-70 factor [Pedobacter steynii]SDM57360.1 RNA polymerase sigma-70 factor, ECF subfamily [Pedobacter steynii]
MQRDHTGFKELYYRDYQQLCNHAFKYLGDRDESEDIVQDVMIRFWELKKEMVHDPAAKYYLLTAVRNRCINVLRKKVYMLSTEENEIEIADTVYTEKPELDVDHLVERAFEHLSPKCAEVFKLSRMGNLTYQQIAAQLNISIKTVENQMGKAIKHMRNFISQNPLLSLVVAVLIKLFINFIGVFSRSGFN